VAAGVAAAVIGPAVVVGSDVTTVAGVTGAVWGEVLPVHPARKTHTIRRRKILNSKQGSCRSIGIRLF